MRKGLSMINLPFLDEEKLYSDPQSSKIIIGEYLGITSKYGFTAKDHVDGHLDIGNLSFGNGRKKAPGILNRLQGKLVQAGRHAVHDLDALFAVDTHRRDWNCCRPYFPSSSGHGPCQSLSSTPHRYQC